MPKKGLSLYISFSNTTVSESNLTGKTENQRIYKINAATFHLLSKRKKNVFKIFTINLTNIEQTLKPKEKGNPAKLLPSQYKEFLPSFS